MLRIDSLIQIFWTKAGLFIAILFTWCLLKLYFFLVYLTIWVFVFVVVLSEARNDDVVGVVTWKEGLMGHWVVVLMWQFGLMDQGW